MRRFILLSLALALAVPLLVPLSGAGAPIGERIDNARKKVRVKRQKEGVLSDTIGRYNTRIEALQGDIRGLMAREDRIQFRLDRKRAQLAILRVRLRRARARLSELRALLRESERALADRLVTMYKADEPDALTVVLEADGFADLLERTEFLELVAEQDGRIVTRVRTLRGAAKRQAIELRVLEGRTEAAALAIRARRDELAASRGRLVRSRADLQHTRDGRAVALSRVRSSRVRLEGDLAALQAQEARVRAALVAAQARTRAPAGPSGGGGGGGGGGAAPGAGVPVGSGPPVVQGSGQLAWPLSGAVVSPFGMRWGRLHAGVDISAPAGTPIRAADSGRVVMLGVMGGYGNYTCVQHTGSLSTCYAHQSSYATSQGASVSQGQVIGYVGCTGHCFGDHLHFETRVNGSPVNPMGYL
jgi:murein DD-endopeptidase MepM/ murein hydrolase activator NlpD